MTLFSNLPPDTQVRLLKIADERAFNSLSRWSKKDYGETFAEILKAMIDAITAVDGED